MFSGSSITMEETEEAEIRSLWLFQNWEIEQVVDICLRWTSRCRGSCRWESRHKGSTCRRFSRKPRRASHTIILTHLLQQQNSRRTSIWPLLPPPTTTKTARITRPALTKTAQATSAHWDFISMEATCETITVKLGWRWWRVAEEEGRRGWFISTSTQRAPKNSLVLVATVALFWSQRCCYRWGSIWYFVWHSFIVYLFRWENGEIAVWEFRQMWQLSDMARPSDSDLIDIITKFGLCAWTMLIFVTEDHSFH